MAIKFFIVFLSFATIIAGQNDLLVPNYDNVEHQLKHFAIKQPLILSCNITKAGDYELTWEKNGTEVSQVSSLEGRYKIINPERKFIIEKTEEKDAGLYSCRVNTGAKRDIRVVANVVVRLPSNTNVVEGEKLSIVCVVVGTEPRLYWEAGNLTIHNSTGRHILKPDSNNNQNAILIVENAGLEDRGEYKCHAKNIVTDLDLAETASDFTYVRVKGKLAAMWPFLGIIAEVFIMCTIILLYERKRTKGEQEETDTDGN